MAFIPQISSHLEPWSHFGKWYGEKNLSANLDRGDVGKTQLPFMPKFQYSAIQPRRRRQSEHWAARQAEYANHLPRANWEFLPKGV